MVLGGALPRKIPGGTPPAGTPRPPPPGCPPARSDHPGRTPRARRPRTRAPPERTAAGVGASETGGHVPRKPRSSIPRAIRGARFRPERALIPAARSTPNAGAARGAAGCPIARGGGGRSRGLRPPAYAAVVGALHEEAHSSCWESPGGRPPHVPRRRGCRGHPGRPGCPRTGLRRATPVRLLLPLARRAARPSSSRRRRSPSCGRMARGELTAHGARRALPRAHRGVDRSGPDAAQR